MIEIKTVNENEVLEIKENHVSKCFTDYLYHKHASDQIQEELNYIAAELSSGSPSTGIILVSKDSKNNLSPWQNELLSKEQELIELQDEHEKAKEQVDQWLANIRNQQHRDIVVEYLINNQCEHAESVAVKCFTTKGNVCKVAQRIVSNIARRIS